MTGTVVTEAVRVSAQAGWHDGRWRSPSQGAGSSLTAAQWTGQLCVYQAPSVGQEVLRIASIGPSQATWVCHTSRRQRKNCLSRFVRRNRRHKSWPENGCGGYRSNRWGLRRGGGFTARRRLLVLVHLHVNSTTTHAYPAVASGARAVRRAIFITIRLFLFIPFPTFPVRWHRGGWSAGAGAACPRCKRLAGGARHSETRLLSAWNARRRVLLIWRLRIRFEARFVIHTNVTQFQRARFRFLLTRSIWGYGG